MKISLSVEVIKDALTDDNGEKLLKRFKIVGPRIATNIPGMNIVVRKSERKGFRVYLVEGKVPVGCIVMRLFPVLNLDIYTENYVYFLPKYRGFGYMSALYRWFLDAGHIYMSDGLHSPGSHKVWLRLSREYPSVVLDTRRWIIEKKSKHTHKDTRMVLFGKNRTVSELEQVLEANQ